MKILRYNIAKDLELTVSLVEFTPIYGIISGNSSSASVVKELTREETRNYPSTLRVGDYTEGNKLDPNVMFEFTLNPSIDVRAIYKIGSDEFVLPGDTSAPLDTFTGYRDHDATLVDTVKSLFPDFRSMWASANSLDILLQEHKTGEYLNEFTLSSQYDAEFFNYFIANPTKFVWDTGCLNFQEGETAPVVPTLPITAEVLSNFRNFASTNPTLNDTTLAERIPMYHMKKDLTDGNSILLAWYTTLRMDSYDYRRLSFAIHNFATLFASVAQKLNYTGSFWYDNRADAEFVGNEYMEGIFEKAGLTIEDFRDYTLDIEAKRSLVGILSNLGLTRIVEVELT